MKKNFLVGLAVGATMISSQAFATTMTVTFNGADIMAYSTAVNPNTTPVIGDGRVDFDNAPSIGTYSRPAFPTTVVSSSSFNGWIDNLSAGEGISQFNLWL